MKTQTKLKIQRLESIEDLGALLEKDIINIQFPNYSGLVAVVIDNNMSLPSNGPIAFIRKDNDKVILHYPAIVNSFVDDGQLINRYCAGKIYSNGKFYERCLKILNESRLVN